MTYSKRKSVLSYVMWLQLYFIEDFTYNCLLKFFTHYENYLTVLKLEVALHAAHSEHSIPFEGVLIHPDLGINMGSATDVYANI